MRWGGVRWEGVEWGWGGSGGEVGVGVGWMIGAGLGWSIKYLLKFCKIFGCNYFSKHFSNT